MKLIGIASSGNAIVEMDVKQARELKAAAERLAVGGTVRKAG